MAEKEVSDSLDNEKKSSLPKTIHTDGGDYVGNSQNKVVVGEISGGTLVIGNRNTVNSDMNTCSMEDFVKLISEIHMLLEQSELDDETQAIVEGDFTIVEEQLAKPEPKRAFILPKLKSIAEVLGTTALIGETMQKLLPMLNQAIQWAQTNLK